MGIGVATLERGRFHVPSRPETPEPSPRSEPCPPDPSVAASTLRLLSEIIALRVPAGRMRAGSDRAGFAAMSEVLAGLAAEIGPVTGVRVARLIPGVATGTFDAIVSVSIGDKVRAVDVQMRSDGRCCRLAGCVLL